MDAHTVLGIGPEASPADIKRAYRRLAMRWHPDRNSHPEATERFKHIRAAYEQLLAVDRPPEAKTATADDAPPETAPAAEPQPEPPADPAPESSRESPRAPDIRQELELTLAEAAAGCRKTVRVTRAQPCATCAGSGEHGISRTRFCAACHGSGRVRDVRKTLASCPECAGRGLFTERICPDCAGSGQTLGGQTLEITVPPAMLAGDELRLAGQGMPGSAGQLPGDLFLTLRLQAHPVFTLAGREVRLEMPVCGLTLLAGGELHIPHPTGAAVRHILAPGTPAARSLRLPGMGYPGRGAYPAGDLVAVLQPVWPVALSEAQRRSVRAVAAALAADAENSLPDIAAWQRRLERRGSQDGQGKASGEGAQGDA